MDFTTHHATPFDSMRAFCIQCMGFNIMAVKSCDTINCPLYPYRIGRRVHRGSIRITQTEAVSIAKRGYGASGEPTINDEASGNADPQGSAQDASEQAEQHG